MFQLFQQGGPLFMGILTIIFILMIVQIVRGFLNKPTTELGELHRQKIIETIKSIALLGLTVGILGQLIGLYSAFSMMETSGGISTTMLAGGLKVSLITTLYGLLIFIVGRIGAMIIRSRT